LQRQRGVFSELSELVQGVQQLAGWLAQTAPLYAPDCRSAPAAGGGSVDLMNQTLDELQRRIDDALQLRAAAADFLARLRTADHRRPQTAKGLFTARRRDGPGTSFGPVRYDTKSYFKVACAQRPTKASLIYRTASVCVRRSHIGILSKQMNGSS